MTHSEVQNRIAEIDRQVNSEVAGSKLPLTTTYRNFPTTTWVLAAVAFAWSFYGDAVPGSLNFHDHYSVYAWYTGLILAALALWGTVLYLFQPRPKISDAYRESTARVRTLQEERRELMVRLRELDPEMTQK